jgi:hypothetical protein
MSEPELLVDRDDVSVMLRRVPDEVPAIRRAWSEMERALRSLRGRKFYGSFDPMTNEYAVCVVLRQGDDPRALGLEQGRSPAAGTLVHVSKGSHRLSTISSRRRCRGSRTGRTEI